MLAHIHPSLQWFDCEARPIFNGLAYPGSKSGTIQDPPRAQSPFARWRRYLHRRNVSCITSEGVTPPSSLIRAHAPDQNPPAAFGFPIQQVFAGCRQPLLGDGPSRRYLRKSFPRCLDPYPGGTLWCICPFLPIGHRPSPYYKRVGSHT